MALWAAAFPLHAATIESGVLSAVPAESATATFSTPDAPGVLLAVNELGGSATMVGSTEFGFEGLWLGSDNTGGQYSFDFSRPVQMVSLAFVALTNLDNGVDPPMAETLASFFTDQPAAIELIDADDTAVWDPAAGALTPLDEVAYGVLQFAAAAGSSFNRIRFDHLQPFELNGFVIERIDFTPAAVPEPAAAGLLALGLAVVAAAARRQVRARRA